jgi:hypothetical protein
MKQKDIIQLVFIGIFAAIVSFIVSGIIFSPKKHTTTVPVVETLQTSMPDIQNDGNYNRFLNKDALDPTLPVQIGKNQKASTSPTNQTNSSSSQSNSTAR